MTGVHGMTRAEPDQGCRAKATEAIRRRLIEHARKRGRLTPVSLDAFELAVGATPHFFLVLDDAIRRLSEHDDRAAEVVRLTVIGWLSARADRESCHDRPIFSNGQRGIVDQYEPARSARSKRGVFGSGCE